MSKAPSSPARSLEQDFITILGKLDAGGRARLKRNAGNTLNEARNVYDVFFTALSYGVSNDTPTQNNFFLIATLFALGTHRNDPTASNPPRNLGASLRLERLERGTDKAGSLDKRFNALLDVDREQLPFRLRQIVSLLASRTIAIDWVQLLRDVRRWEQPERSVQRYWAEAYYRSIPVPVTADSAE